MAERDGGSGGSRGDPSASDAEVGTLPERGRKNGRPGRRLIRSRQAFGCFAAAILAAPFLAFALHPALGLLTSTVALSALAWLALTQPSANAEQRRRLRVVAVLNGVLALACLGLLVARLIAG